MIKYDLKCDEDHVFEGWFPSSKDFEKQEKRNLISCPSCGSVNVGRALMAPAVKRAKIEKSGKNIKNTNIKEKDLKTQLRTLNKLIEKNTVDVGKNFAQEARMIYKGKKKDKPIRGSATSKEEKELKKDGIPFIKVPWIKDN